MRNLIVFFTLAVLTSSCTVNSDIMFKTPTEYEYDEFIETVQSEYSITTNDILNFRLFTNNGIQLLELNRNQPNASRNLSFSLNYVVRPDSLVDLPSLGLVNITGLTVPEAQDSLASMYEVFYNDPYVQLEVTNNRVIVFPGSGGSARTIALSNNNTSVIEVLAMAGGISSRGKAKKIKLIRKENGEIKVYLLDLSTIEGVKYANSVVQANDIIYVEPTAELAREILRDITPVISLVSSLFTIYSLTQLNN